jgi:hypothetical protein
MFAYGQNEVNFPAQAGVGGGVGGVEWNGMVQKFSHHPHSAD